MTSTPVPESSAQRLEEAAMLTFWSPFVEKVEKRSKYQKRLRRRIPARVKEHFIKASRPVPEKLGPPRTCCGDPVSDLSGRTSRGWVAKVKEGDTREIF